MSFVEIRNDVPYDLFEAWVENISVHARALSSTNSPVYVAFVDDDRTYLYLPHVAGACADAPSNRDATPVYCSPDVDMSCTTFEQLANVSSVPYAAFTIDSLTIGDIIDELSKNITSLMSCVEDELKNLCVFVSRASPGFDTSKLESYIKYEFCKHGQKASFDALFGTQRRIRAIKHTRLELMSELVKCNKNLYHVYKYDVLRRMLRDILANSRSKAEIEHGISGLAHEILCDSVVHCLGTLWCFIDGVWKECSSDGYLWNFLTRDFIEFLVEENADDIALRIKSVTARTGILKDVKLRLQNDDFAEMLDSKRNIIRMVNGVYDTHTDMLSDPAPSDYASVVAGVPYQVFDYGSAQMGQLMSILGTIFPTTELLDFFVLSCATFLEGYNSPKVFYVWWGTGNNAKSLVQTLVMKTFGQYCSTAPTSLVTGKRTESSGATPDLCHVEKKLVVFLQEPNPEERVRAGRMKEMTGNDSMYVRQLFKSGRTVTLKAKLVIVCNNIIEIPGMDAAIRRRMIVIPFRSTFLDASEYKLKQSKSTLEKNSFHINPMIEKTLLSCKSAFMYLLCRRYREWADSDNFFLKVPPTIREVTNDYMTRNNHQLMFVRRYVHYLRRSNFLVTEAYEQFKDWIKRSYPGKKVADLDKFVHELSEEGYKADDKGILNDVFVSYNGEN